MGKKLKEKNNSPEGGEFVYNYPPPHQQQHYNPQQLQSSQCFSQFQESSCFQQYSPSSSGTSSCEFANFPTAQSGELKTITSQEVESVINSDISQYGSSHNTVPIEQVSLKSTYQPPNKCSQNYNLASTSNLSVEAPGVNNGAVISDLIEYPRANSNNYRTFSLVSQYPNTDNFAGVHDLQIDFIKDSAKVIVDEWNGRRVLFTRRREAVLVYVKHSAGPDASVRFYVVFDDPSDITHPVHPCKNDQDNTHPEHILSVEGVVNTRYEVHPHPSVVVQPIPAEDPHGQILVYKAYVKALCRNSCHKRKNLLLIIQLEKDNEVLGRESFMLKVGACPRRDWKDKKKQKQARQYTQQQQTSAKIMSENFKNKTVDQTLLPQYSEQQFEESLLQSISDPLFTAAVTNGKQMSEIQFLAKTFKSLHPEEYKKAQVYFETLWNQKVLFNP